MANVARKHHYVSQFYLKEFLNSNKKIHVIDVVEDGLVRGILVVSQCNETSIV